MRDFDIRGQRFRIHRKAVILRGDRDLARAQILHRLVAAAVSELQLESFSADGVAEHLVPEADAENRRAAHELADVVMHIRERGRIAGAVGKEDAVGLQREHVLGGKIRRHHAHAEAFLPQPAEDVRLHSEIIRDDLVLHRRQLFEDLVAFADFHICAVALHDGPLRRELAVRIPVERRVRRDLFHKIRPGHRRRALRTGDRGVHIEFARDARLHRAARAQVLRERARVHALDAGDFPFREIRVQVAGRAPVARDRGEFLDHEAADVDGAALVVERVHAVVADLRRGHRDDLSAIRGIGEDLLVAGHRGVETRLADGCSRSTK